MKSSNLFGKTIKEKSKEADNVSSELLLRGQFIDKLASGIYTLLPLGLRVQRKIEEIIRQEMAALGGEELLMPVLQPQELWEKTGRWTTIDPPLFKVKDRHGRELGLGSTHEEIITDLVSRRLQSYQDLPLLLYQIQTKFRNELRSSGGLLRVREFVMKDAYSFHASAEDLAEFYQKVKKSYDKIFQRCGLKTVAIEADSGSIGGSESHEFILLAETGEDKVAICQKCGLAAKMEIIGQAKKCSKCHGQLIIKNGIENGHIFKLGAKYSRSFNLYFADENGQRQLVEMGCYGIGLGRLLAAIVEASHDEKGIIWPASVAPYSAHLIDIDSQQQAKKIYDKLVKEDAGVLYDDRDISPGEKFADADLIGCPWRLVVSPKTIVSGKIEIKRRDERKGKLINIKNLKSQISKL